jgi:hypothetical protein
VVRKPEDVLAALAQRRYLDGELRQPIVQVQRD